MRAVIFVTLYVSGLLLLIATLRRKEMQLLLIEARLLLPSAELQDGICV